MKRFRIIIFVIVGFLVFTTVGVLAVNKSQTPNITTITEPTLTLVKTFDGTTRAAVTPGELTGIQGLEGVIFPTGVLTGLFGLDDVKVSAVANYDTANAGSAKTITVVYTLEGKDSGNYVKPIDYTVATGEIAAVPLTIGEPVLSPVKEFEGTTTSTVTPGALTGILGTDDITVSAVATYDTADVGTDKTITVIYTLGGANAANYVTPVPYTVATGEITAPPIVVVTPDYVATDYTTSNNTTSNYTAPTASSYTAPSPAAPAAPAITVPNVITSATVAP
ncbi:MAG: YDG domain-containing protein [Acetobacterium sp.]